MRHAASARATPRSYKQIQIDPFVDFSALDAGDSADHPQANAEGALTPADAAKAAGLFFFVVVIQLSVMANVDILGGASEPLLVTLVMVALLRGAIFGAVAGFCVGLLWTRRCSARSASPPCS